jgi:hypothetical protein
MIQCIATFLTFVSVGVFLLHAFEAYREWSS